jgi:hypothetical protein
MLEHPLARLLQPEASSASVEQRFVQELLEGLDLFTDGRLR